MKKIVLILFICVYSLSTFGFSLKGFYCCGNLKSVSVAFVDNSKNKCGKGDNKEGCCKTKYQYLKVKDNHLATGQLTNPVKYTKDLISYNSNCQNTTFIAEANKNINVSHAPPLNNSVPIYILNCVFRV